MSEVNMTELEIELRDSQDLKKSKISTISELDNIANNIICTEQDSEEIRLSINSNFELDFIDLHFIAYYDNDCPEAINYVSNIVEKNGFGFGFTDGNNCKLLVVWKN